MGFKKSGPFVPKKYVIDGNAWAQEKFIKRNALGEYFFDSADFSKLAGEPEDKELAKKGEGELLNSFLEQQVQLM